MQQRYTFHPRYLNSYCSFGIFLLLFLAAEVIHAPSGTRAFVQRCPTINCERTVFVDAGTTATLSFSVTPNSNNPTYNWSVSAGIITSGQSTSTLTVSDVSIGQTSEAKVTMGRLRSGCPRVLTCETNVAQAPPRCATVTVVCPDDVEEGKTVTFTTNFTGSDPKVTPTFNWHISAGTIKEGKGTPSITVDTTGLGGESITATVNVGGYPPDCNTTGSCTTTVKRRSTARRQGQYRRPLVRVQK